MSNIKLVTFIIGILLLGSCTTVSEKLAVTESQKTEEVSAYVMIPKDQTAGVSKINSLDGERVEFIDLLPVSSGIHTLGVACKLDNGVGLSYSLEIDFEAQHYYCIKAVNPGKTCAVGYVKSLSIDAAKIACLIMGK
ncbi:MAG: hypothetical protein JKY88_16190 [Pseudomonadales bacterium]|nr:hypothetical protein [Pseudomonadales bacterium]